MGLRERATSLTGKELIGTFFAAEVIDTAMTSASLNFLGGTEINPTGAELLTTLEQNEVFVLKVAVTTLLISLYALTSNEKIIDKKVKFTSIKPNYVLERGLQGANIFAWSVVAWNTANLVPDLISKLNT